MSNSVVSSVPDSVLSQESSTVLVVSLVPLEEENKMSNSVVSSVPDSVLPQESSTVLVVSLVPQENLNLPLPNKINSSVLPLLCSPDSSVVSCPENNRSNSVDSFLPDSVLSQESSTVLVVSSKPPEEDRKICLGVNLSTLWPTSIDNKIWDGVTSSVLDLVLPQESSTV